MILSKMNEEIVKENKFTIFINGQPVIASEGATVAATLLAHGFKAFFNIEPPFSPNRYFCGMGVCMQCLVTINNIQGVRACRTKVQPNMVINTIG